MTQLSLLFRWVLWTSAQATLLVCLILVIQRLLRHKLNPEQKAKIEELLAKARRGG